MAHADPQILRARPSNGLTGAISTPGDKSISHRALILGALAEGETRIDGLLEGDDVLRTAAAMRALGAEIERDGGVWRVMGDAWRSPVQALYFGNSGTGCRLVMGAAAGAGVNASYEGDASLRTRPMNRILDPLTAMGAETASDNGRLPCQITGNGLKGLDYVLPTPSAQIKSAILLAGLGATGSTTIIEPIPCRDHTERMLPAFGVNLDITAENGGRAISLKGGQRLQACALTVPGDPSSAAFIAAAALITQGADVTIRNVLVNPHRAGFFKAVQTMGGDLVFDNERQIGGEAVADIRVRSSDLKGIEVPAAQAASMIDEYPILSVIAAFADGETLMHGLAELRVKESDRLAATQAGLSANGVKTESGEDWLRVFGQAGNVAGGGRIAAHHDHRIAMSFLVLGLAAKKAVETDSAPMIDTRFPGFANQMRRLGADIS